MRGTIGRLCDTRMTHSPVMNVSFFARKVLLMKRGIA